jgi:hypothetical protein
MVSLYQESSAQLAMDDGQVCGMLLKHLGEVVCEYEFFLYGIH